jgi:hypothetical protein
MRLLYGIHIGHFSEFYLQLQKIIGYAISYKLENADVSKGSVDINGSSGLSFFSYSIRKCQHNIRMNNLGGFI